MRLQLRFFFLGVLALAAFSVLAWSQGSFGGLTGNITDQSGQSFQMPTSRWLI